MSRLFVLVFAALYCCQFSNLNAQSSYRAGYLIDNLGQRSEVDIRERNWSENPTSITYRLPNADGSERRVVVGDLRGFGLIADQQHFVRSVVSIEQSSGRTADLTYNPKPTFKTDTVWLRQLVEGEAALFYWSGRHLDRYFYRVDGGTMEALTYRQFLVGSAKVRSDMRYRYTLKAQLSCGGGGGGGVPDVEQIDYNRKDLVKYFVGYNACRGGRSTVYVSKNGPKPRFAIRLGAVATAPSFSLFTLSGTPYGSMSFDDRVIVVPGIEIEQPLEFTNRRWSIFLGAGYRSRQIDREEARIQFGLRQRSIETPMGVRLRGFDLGRTSYYLMGGAIGDFPIGDSYLQRGSAKYDLAVNFGFLAGAGIRIGDHFELEARYRFRRNLLSTHIRLQMVDSGPSLNIAYRL